MFWRINQAADDVRTGDLKLIDQLLLPVMAQDSPEAERNRLRVDGALQGNRRMLIIAPLASYSLEREQRMKKDLAIAGFHRIPKAFMRPGQWELLSKRYRAAVAGWKAGQTAVVIAQVEVKERDGRQSANVIDAALMAVTPQWIPTESSHKRMIVEKLVTEGRSFNKPLLYNQERDDVFPDFILTDCASGEVLVEVFGRDDEHYLKRKADKTAYYNRQYGVGG